MKKTILLTTISAFAIFLAACGSQASSSAEETTANVKTEENETDAAESKAESGAGEVSKDKNLITFKDKILADNDIVKLELVNFYAQEVNTAEGKQNQKYISIKATNKTDHDFFLNPEFYLDGEKAYVALQGGSIGPAPGKSANYSFLVARDTKPQPTPLETLEELYDLEGAFEGLEELESGNESIEVNFSIPEALGNKEVSEETSGAESIAESAEETVEETKAAETGIWSQEFYVDDFNQPTDQWYITTAKYFPGTFSNSAVTNANLAVKMAVDVDKNVTFFLYEYNRSLVKNFSNRYDDTYSVTMRTADGVDHNLTGTIYCGGDRLFIDDAYIDAVIAALEGEGNVSFLIVNNERTVESYLVTIMPSNFKEVYESATQQP